MLFLQKNIHNRINTHYSQGQAMKTLRKFIIILTSTLLLISFQNAFANSDVMAQEGVNAINKGAKIIDVRTDGEFNSGHLDKAVNIPYQDIANRIAEVSTDKDEPIVVYCRSGRRSGIAQKTLQSVGYKNVINGGGFKPLTAKLKK